jgi:hypothetical protein
MRSGPALTEPRVEPKDSQDTDELRQFEERLHAHRLTLLSVSSGMVGVCLTGIGLIGVLKHLRRTETVIDELLTGNALLFLITTALYFVLLRRARQGHRRVLDHVADATFFYRSPCCS